jgi:hypothetical protein
MVIRKAISLLIEFLKVWFFMFFTFVTLKVLCNVIVYGWIDIRRVAIMEILLVPLGQSAAFWLVVKTFRKRIMKPDRPT